MSFITGRGIGSYEELAERRDASAAAGAGGVIQSSQRVFLDVADIGVFSAIRSSTYSM